MVTVGRRGRGPVVVGALVVAAFLVGLVRPWDWLAGTEADPVPGQARAPSGEPVGGPSVARGGRGGSPLPGSPAPAGAATTATCGNPSSWRTSSISFWAGARAQIWTAAEAVPARGPDDPAIPFHAIASDRVEALGWCAPVSGPERPPLSAKATLYRLREGVAIEVPSDRLEPEAGDALGELRVPAASAPGGRQPWAPGRYVIRLATPSGSYERFLGIEVGVPPRPSLRPSSTSSPLPSTTAAPTP